jgi:nitroreductase
MTLSMSETPSTIPPPEPIAQDHAWESFENIVGSRRAVRDFSPRSVAEDDMRALFDASVLAPTSSNLQPFELCWVRSPEKRDALVRACLSQPAAEKAAELVVCVARWDRCDDTRRELIAHLKETSAYPPAMAFYFEHLARWAYDQGPLGIFGRARALLAQPVLLVRPLPRGPANRSDVRVWAQKSTALVAQTFMLAARAKGLDTCPMEGCDPVRVGKIVGLDASEWKRSWDLSMVIAVGYRAADIVLEPRWRRDTSELVREV